MKNVSCIIGWMIVPLAACGIAHAQPESAPNSDEWLIRTWHVDEGLPDSSAAAMVQTPDGHLWFGTFRGLVRFDGATFTVLDPENTPKLPSREIINLHVDRRGWLWVGTSKGLVVRNNAGWIDLPTDPAFQSDLIRTFAERKNGDLLFTTFDGKIIEFDGSRFVRLPEPPGETGQGYWGGVDEDGHWWVVQNEFVGLWNGQQWVAIIPARELEGIERECVGCAAARDGGLWILVGTTLCEFSHGKEVARRQLPNVISGTWRLSEDTRHDIWIASYSGGVHRVSPDGKVSRWTEIEGVRHRSFRFVFEDREGNLWIGTDGRGLICLTPRRVHDFGTRDALSMPVSSLSPAPGGGVWLGTCGDGLFRLDEHGVTRAAITDLPSSGYIIQSVLTDQRGRTWIGIFDHGVYVFDRAGGKYVLKNPEIRESIRALFEDSRGRIWFSCNGGIACVEDDDVHTIGADQDLPAGDVVCIAEDRDGAIWLSNLAGVFRIVADRIVEVHGAGGAALRNVVSLRSDTDGSMWLGTTVAGLMRWKDGVWATIGPEAGLSTKSVLGILDDEQGYFWMASPHGILRVEKTELQAVADGRAPLLNCQLFDSNDGLPTCACSGSGQPVCMRDERGRLWFAMMNGVAVVDPDHFRFNTVPPQVHIEKIVYRTPTNTDGEVDLCIEPPFAESLRLPAGSRGVEIHYTAPSFVAPERVRFQVLLEPADATWRDLGNRRVVYYDDLRAGDYCLRVRAANDDGVWSLDAASLKFTVLPLFWETSWFRMLLIVASCGVALGWIYRLHTRQRRQAAIQTAFARQLIARQEAERSRVASELHDGLGHSLLLIKTRLTQFAEQAGNAPQARAGFEELATDMTHAITEVRSISRALRPSALTRVGLTYAITWMIEELRTATTMEYVTDLDDIDGLLTHEMEINFYRIVQEALSNIIKHAAASHVIVKIKRSPSSITVLIQDNGCGFDMRHVREHTQASFGLTGMTERANSLDGRVNVESAPGTGTRVAVTVPIPGQAT